MKKAIKILGVGGKEDEEKKQNPEILASVQNDNYDNSQLRFKCSWLLNVECPGRQNPKLTEKNKRQRLSEQNSLKSLQKMEEKAHQFWK